MYREIRGIHALCIARANSAIYLMTMFKYIIMPIVQVTQLNYTIPVVNVQKHKLANFTTVHIIQ